MKSNLKLYAMIFAASLLAHGIFGLLHGISLTKDFSGLYEPMAVQMMAWFEGAGNFPAISSSYELFHIIYMFFVSAVYLVFGTHNHLAMVAVQVVISSGAVLLVFRFLKMQCDSKTAAVLSAMASFLFFESMNLAIAGSPESIYRSIFVVSFLALIHLHHQHRHRAFLATAIVSFVVLLGIRIDTVILFIPVYALALRTLRDRIGLKKPSVPVLSAAIMILFLCFSLVTKLSDIEHPILRIDEKYYVEGIVVADLGAAGKIEPLEPGVKLGVSESFQRSFRLFFLRVYQYLTIIPPSWSAAHKAYYAVHMVPLYLLALAGLARLWFVRNFFFSLVAQCYAASILLHGLTRVDAAHRTNFISVIFLIMLAGYGFDWLIEIFRRRGMHAGFWKHLVFLK